MIPVCEPTISPSDVLAVTNCMRSGWITAGPYVDQFEKEWAALNNRKHGIAVSNGTTALELAVKSLNLKPDDEVIIPSFTIISCYLAVERAGAKARWVDVDDTWCIDPHEVERAITPHTKAIMPVHMYGQPADMDALDEIARTHNITIIEDAAQAHGASYKQRPCGSFGRLSCFSFYGNKIVTTGEGGMILVDDERLANYLRWQRNLCFGEGDDRFQHLGCGHNYRMTDMQAALGCSQIKRLGAVLEGKQRVGRLYRELLDGQPNIRLQVQRQFTNPVYWMNGLLVPNAHHVAAELKVAGIDTRPFFVGMHRQACTKGDIVPCPKTDDLSEHGLYLPSSPFLPDATVAHICQQVKTLTA